MGRRRRKQQSLRAILAASWRAEGYAEGVVHERRRLADREAAADALAVRMTRANVGLWRRCNDLQGELTKHARWFG